MKKFLNNINFDLEAISYEKHEDMKVFYNNIKSLILCLMNSNIKKSKKQPLVYETIKEKLNIFITKTLKILKNNAKVLSEYMHTFNNLIQFGEFSNIRNEINVKSINNGLEIMKKYKFFIFITVEIKFDEIWLFLNEKEQKKFAEIMNKMYFASLMYKKKNNDKLYFEEPKELIIPRIEYEENILGETDTIKIVIDETIDKNENIKDEKYKKEVIEDSHNVVDDIVGTLVESGIKDSNFLNAETFMKINNSNMIHKTKEKLKNRIKKTPQMAGKMVDMVCSMMNQYKNKMETENSGLKYEAKKMMNTLLTEIYKNTSKNKIKNKDASKLLNNIRDNFYDPNIKPYTGKERNKILNNLKKKK
jgi:hypothetical protein